jgi:hypothetical protein
MSSSLSTAFGRPFMRSPSDLKGASNRRR